MKLCSVLKRRRVHLDSRLHRFNRAGKRRSRPACTRRPLNTETPITGERTWQITGLKGSSRHGMGAGAADPQCPACHGKGSEYGQRCPCVERRLREALELPLLLHTDEQQKQRWREITGADEFTAAAMCTHIRGVLRE